MTNLFSWGDKLILDIIFEIIGLLLLDLNTSSNEPIDSYNYIPKNLNHLIPVQLQEQYYIWRVFL